MRNFDKILLEMKLNEKTGTKHDNYKIKGDKVLIPINSDNNPSMDNVIKWAKIVDGKNNILNPKEVKPGVLQLNLDGIIKSWLKENDI